MCEPYTGEWCIDHTYARREQSGQSVIIGHMLTRGTEVRGQRHSALMARVSVIPLHQSSLNETCRR